MIMWKGILDFLASDSNLIFSWLILMVIFLIIEIITLGLTTIWFAGGALIAFILALCGAAPAVQIMAFFVVSFALLIFTRPVVQKRLNDSREKTNVNSMIGKEGKVTEAIDNFNGTGRIMVGGMEWTARAREDSEVIPQNARVAIQEIKGVKAIVTRMED